VTKFGESLAKKLFGKKINPKKSFYVILLINKYYIKTSKHLKKCEMNVVIALMTPYANECE
jgi:uncharacterized protein (UPF0332 family)